MIPNPSIDELSRRIRRRNEMEAPGAWPGAYILFLGEGCARAAGAPSRADIARETLRMSGGHQPDSGMRDEELFARFEKLTSEISPASLSRMMRTIYSRIAVPSFYQYLALLIREGYFPLVMTMNFDTLLEQALENAGTRSSEYRTTTFGPKTSSWPDNFKPGSPPITHVIKLHGDLRQGIVQITPEQIQSALESGRQWIKSDLKGDIVMVEHVLSDDPIDQWLAHFPHRELWWVAEKEPADPAQVSRWAGGELNFILGDLGRPQAFFPQLALRLLRPDDAGTGVEELEPPTDVAETEAPSPAAVRSVSMSPDPVAETLHNEILRNQSVLYNLEQEGTSGERSPQVEAQIAYHKQQTFHLEDRIRSLPDVRSRVLACVKAIGERIRERGYSALPDNRATVDAMVKFVDLQLETLEAEFQQESPNQYVVSASLGATLTLADRLATEFGGRIVDSNDVKDLASLVPTAAGKVVL